MTHELGDRSVRLQHGVHMPRLGFGTWPLDDAVAERAVADAVEAGFRLIDTAENYENEAGVGAGMRAAAISRDEVFVTTKFNRQWHGEDLVRTALQRSLERLGLDYVDLLMIHWPNPAGERYLDAWRGMVQLKLEGRVRAIGTSNFKVTHLERLRSETGVLPDVNQIQLNPFMPRLAERVRFAELGIVTQSWAPLGGREGTLRDHPLVRRVAEAHRCTPAQVVLRWHLQSGLAVVVKSAHREHMRDNLRAFDVNLTANDLAAIDQLERDDLAPIDSDTAGH